MTAAPAGPGPDDTTARPDAPQQPTGGPIGRSVPRLHDDRLLRGQGRFTDDIDDGTALHAVVLRSPVAHGRLTRFDAGAARADGRAVLVLGPDEIARHTRPLPTVWRIQGQRQDTIELAPRTVRYAGQPVGLVVAAGRAEAEDVAELVETGYEPLPAVVGTDAALADGAPLVHPEYGGNTAGSARFGDPEDEVERALAGAAHVVTRELGVQRVAYTSLETRALLAEWTPGTEQLTVWAGTQVPHPFRYGLARALRLRVDQVRVAVPDLGGAFGGKTVLHADETLVCLAARLLGRRVAWTEDRAEALTASYQGRGMSATARLGLDADGRFVALDAHITGDVGAFVSQAGTGPFQVAAQAIEGPYRFGRAGASVRAVWTNAVPTGAYRGYGMQEACWIRERLVAEAARELGLPAAELRRRNLIGPEELPYTTRTFSTYDTGDYPRALHSAEQAVADAPRVREGRIRRGAAAVPSIEATGYGPTSLLEAAGMEAGGWESGRIRVNEDGTVTVFAGVVAMGQGIETALAQIVADRLGVPLGLVAVRLGDTDTTPRSEFSSQASRSVVVAGGALMRAGARMRERMHALAASLLETSAEDVRLDVEGEDEPVFRAAKTSRTATWAQVAHRGWLGWGRPDPDRIVLEETVDFDPPGLTYAYAAHAAAVAVDLDTGQITVEGYWAFSDSGPLVNPMIAEGQIAGAVAQGLGIALTEEAALDPSTGLPLTTSLRDYELPAPATVPTALHLSHTSTPGTVVPGGFKGLGEGGMLPAPVVVANAVADAVPEIARRLERTPLSPYRVWTMLRDAGLATG
ncbi:xanthine dehydrogenase family protein molybdopterin-binding subunit [Streptomyces cacaoi]|uniref:xanthine dehydrogenase family protein molybdopterin-binding subunit n=1 Tax=Streptomyces cacaoi TaxID=1898 RepID=UPI0026180913|nr:xanthine dehydrogenase family protein molybdopterin-binding subunit [Streptomyces cacaoi]